MFGFLRPKRLAVHEMSPGAFMAEHDPSLVFTARLRTLPEFPDDLGSVSYVHAGIDELGFGRRWSDPFTSQPPRDLRFDEWCTDRFFFAQSAGSRGGSLARVAIDEARVHHGQLRSELDYTGFRVSVALRDDAFRPFLDFVASRASRKEFQAPLFAMRMPSPPFAFPDLRGNPDPWSAGDAYTRDLQAIRRFKLDEFSLAIVEYRTTEKPQPGSALAERYDVLSACKFRMVRR